MSTRTWHGIQKTVKYLGKTLNLYKRPLVIIVWINTNKNLHQSLIKSKQVIKNTKILLEFRYSGHIKLCHWWMLQMKWYMNNN